jgi:hypothetical protein
LTAFSGRHRWPRLDSEGGDDKQAAKGTVPIPIGLAVTALNI